MIQKLTETIYNELKIRPHCFGFAGEVYITSFKSNDEHRDTIKKYTYTYQNTCVNRKASYYSDSFKITCELLKETYNDFNEVKSWDISVEFKRYLLFTVTEYTLHCLSKLLHVCFENMIFRDSFYLKLKNKIEEISKTLVSLMFSDNISNLYLSDMILTDEITAFYKEGEEPLLREHVEYDHKLLLIFAYILYRDIISEDTLLICPLLGAALIPPVFKAIDSYFVGRFGTQKSITYDYIKHSTYDISSTIELNKQVDIIKQEHFYFNKMLLLDESLGTGTTLLELRDALVGSFKEIKLGAVEFRWDKKIVYNNVRNWFDIEKIDYITPISYRHYLILDRQITSFKMEIVYITVYKPYMIYKDINFDSYISEQNINGCKIETLNVMFEKCRRIEEVFYNQR